MALPPILACGKHDDLLRKSESEVFEIIESAVALAALRWPEELLAHKHRLLKHFFTKARSPLHSVDDGYITSAVSDHHTEEDPTKPTGRTTDVPCVQVTRDQNSSNLANPTSTTTPVGKSETETAPAPLFCAPKPPRAPPSGRLEESKKVEDEYEKKLENCKRKLQHGYNQYTDSRKRSKVIDFIPLESNHDRFSKPAAIRRTNGQNPKVLTTLGRSTLGRC